MFGLYHPWRKKLWKFNKSIKLFTSFCFLGDMFLRIGSHGIFNHLFAPPFGKIFGDTNFSIRIFFPAVANLRGDGDVMTGCEMQCGEVGRGSMISMGRRC